MMPGVVCKRSRTGIGIGINIVRAIGIEVRVQKKTSMMR